MPLVILPEFLTFDKTVRGDYTISQDDIGLHLAFDATRADITVTIPTNLSVGFRCFLYNRTSPDFILYKNGAVLFQLEDDIIQILIAEGNALPFPDMKAELFVTQFETIQLISEDLVPEEAVLLTRDANFHFNFDGDFVDSIKGLTLTPINGPTFLPQPEGFGLSFATATLQRAEGSTAGIVKGHTHCVSLWLIVRSSIPTSGILELFFTSNPAIPQYQLNLDGLSKIQFFVISDTTSIDNSFIESVSIPDTDIPIHILAYFDVAAIQPRLFIDGVESTEPVQGTPITSWPGIVEEGIFNVGTSVGGSELDGITNNVLSLSREPTTAEIAYLSIRQREFKGDLIV